MGKEFFSHDYGTRNKLKMAALIEDCGTRGYGLFWIIVEMMYEDSDNWLELADFTYLAIKKESKEELEYIREFIQKCIHTYQVFIEQDGKISSERVHRNIEKRADILEKRKEAGKKSAEKRLSLSTTYQQNSAGAQQVLNKIEQNSTKERKGKERKGNVSNTRANALVIAGDDSQRHLKSEYESILKSLEGKSELDTWNALRLFIQEKKPRFINPYMDIWNFFAIKRHLIVNPQTITDKRQKKFNTRINEDGFDFLKILEKISTSAFLKGNNQNHWKVTIEFILDSQENYTKILEGKYD